MKTRIRSLAACCLFWIAGTVSAAPTLWLYVPYGTPTQVSDNPRVRTALEATAYAYWPYITVAAGYTLSCDGLGISLQEQKEASNTTLSFPNTVATYIPYQGGVLERDLAWWMPKTECRTCALNAKGVAAESVVSIGASKGFNISFNLGNETTTITTPTFDMCRPELKTCTVANAAVTLLTETGESKRLDAVSGGTLQRKGGAEDGRAMVMDEYALVKGGADGARFSYTSAGFGESQVALSGTAATGKSRLVAELVNAAAIERELPSTTGLLIKHQAQHPANHNFAPVPTASFTQQDIADSRLNGERGFAIVQLGESGKVMQVQALSTTGRPAPPSLKESLARAIRTSFPDERRHDHTVYWAYEVQDGAVKNVGDALVTLPMCCPKPCPGRCP